MEFDGSRFSHSKRRSQNASSTAKTACIWACDVCGYKFNKDHAVKCEMCEFKGPVTRFGFVIRGAHFLCSVHSARPPEKVDLLRACNTKSGTQLETVLDGTSDVELPTRIIRTFIREHGATQQIRDETVEKLSVTLKVDYPLPEDIADEHENSEILAEKLAHFDYGEGEEEEGEAGLDIASGEATPTATGASLGGEPLDRRRTSSFKLEGSSKDMNVDFVDHPASSITTNLTGMVMPDNSRQNTAASSLASIDTEDSMEESGTYRRHSQQPAKGGKKKRKKKKKNQNEKMDLFEQVMENGKGLVYDPSVGQFRERKGISRRKSISPADLANLHGVSDHFHYIKFMKREKDAMTFKLDLLMKEKSGEKHEAPTNEDIEAEYLKGSSVLQSHLNKPCTLCEMVFKPWNLPGVVPFKAVSEWRRKHGKPFDKTDRRLAQSRVYEACRLCLFCTQFFDADFSDFVEYHLGSTDVADPALEVEDTSGRKNELDPKVTKSLQDYSQKGIIKQDFIRPTSAFLQEMEMDALRDKKFLPKLMSNMGCQLARNVRPENQPKTLFSPTTKHGGLGSSMRNKNKRTQKKTGRGSMRGQPVKLKALTGSGGERMSRREMLLESLNRNAAENAMSPKGPSGATEGFEESERRLRQSGVARNNNLKRKKKKRKESVTHVKQHSVDISALEDLLDETEVPVKEFSKTMPEKGRGKKGKGFRGKEMQPPEESAYRQSMRRATNVYV
ncbi:hypothetical protein TrST_g1969 [Triparma strigata]|uniref:Uncharacterized protein n=1 Tax=Triparma strigata TaxID=1606541 RepID=A0A9W7ANX7_9STRA|nr:hypothetical protein TrST_g1969 [Triparma strigata]